MAIKAVVFDFDGVIIDTEIAEFQAWQEIYTEHGSHLPVEVWAACIGTSADAFDPYDYLEKQVNRTIDRQAVGARRRERHLSLVAEKPVMPGVVECLLAARELNIRVGLASSSTLSWVEGLLARHGLLAYFDDIKCADHVEKVKPYPDLYQASLAALGVAGNEAIAFEDSLNGLLAAKAAGLYCVVIPHDLTRHLVFDQADLILNSLAEMPLAAIIKKVAG
ncbi:MAG TPA: HAD family hydrolase [Firmicutes bacterium]|nr:HAD family hydrolase [Bacillota bacterium]